MHFLLNKQKTKLEIFRDFLTAKKSFSSPILRHFIDRNDKNEKSEDYSFSFLFLYILVDLISFLEIQRLHLAGFSSTVFAVNLTETTAFPNTLSCTSTSEIPIPEDWKK